MFKIFDVIAVVLMLSSVAFGVGPSLSGTGLDMNGYKVSDMLNGTSNQDAITYSQLIASVSAISSNEYVFTGTTGSELHTFIDTYGPGTYILANPITITSTLTIDQNHVIIKGLAHGTNIYHLVVILVLIWQVVLLSVLLANKLFLKICASIYRMMRPLLLWFNYLAETFA